ncbi:MAG TPA: chalcone isomerase family protein [Acetobacteraceae bacterium]|nr:chalcone isomerase family protein [Acetobacteraceae bacterium]
MTATFHRTRIVVALAALWLGLTELPAPADAAGANDFPPTIDWGNQTLVRNGVGERTFSFLHIRIYVAALYLTRPSHDATEIIERMPARVLIFRFIRDVDEERARAAWKEGFDDNCTAPCRVSAPVIAGFLARVTALHAGDETSLAVIGNTVTARNGSRALGSVDDAAFAHLVLASFIGSKPASEALKRGLLGER